MSDLEECKRNHPSNFKIGEEPNRSVEQSQIAQYENLLHLVTE